MAKIDPRMVTTPLGAALGVLLAHNLMRRGQRRPVGYAAGALAGGAGGYVVGKYIKSAEPLIDAQKALTSSQKLAHMTRWRKQDIKRYGIPPTDDELGVMNFAGLSGPDAERSLENIKALRRQWGGTPSTEEGQLYLDTIREYRPLMSKIKVHQNRIGDITNFMKRSTGKVREQYQGLMSYNRRALRTLTAELPTPSFLWTVKNIGRITPGRFSGVNVAAEELRKFANAPSIYKQMNFAQSTK